MDKDIVLILEALLNSSLITINRLQNDFNYSKRQINYRMSKINDILKLKSVPLIYLESNKEIVIRKETKKAIKEILNKEYSKNTYYFNKEERMIYIYLLLFINKEYISINYFINSLRVSKTTINYDFKSLLPKLEKHNIKINNSRTNGYYLSGSEVEIRNLLITSVIKSIINSENYKIFDIFIKEYKLDTFEDTRKNILKIFNKYNVSFVENRLIEFIYIFIFFKERISSKRNFSVEEIQVPRNLNICYMKEYKLAKELLELYIDENVIDKKDIIYISAWIIGVSVGNYQEYTEDRQEISEIINKMMDKFWYLSGVYYINREKIFEQLYSHFRPAYYRLLFKLPIYNEVFERVKDKYSAVYKIVNNIMNDFSYIFGNEIQEEELCYLTMHFAVLFYNKKEDTIKKKVALVVCSNGVGSSLILYIELKNLFPNIHFLLPVEYSKVEELIDSADIIFTTNSNIYNFTKDIPIIKVNPVMSNNERCKILREVSFKLENFAFEQIKLSEILTIIKKHTNVISEDTLLYELSAYFAKIESFSFKEGEKPMLSEITNEKLVKLNINAKNCEDAVRKASSVLLENEKVTEEYIEAIIKSIKENGSYIVITKNVALPHSRPEYGAKEIAISIATLKEPVKFGNLENDPVKYIFCLSAIDNDSHLRAISELVDLLENKSFYAVLDNATSGKQIIDFIKEYEKK